jgi:hypothetical protein
MYLGFDERRGLFYQGIHLPELPIVPTPIVTQAKLIEAEQDWQSLPSGFAQSPFSWVFREDTFDSVTRIRRGRLYAASAGQQPLDVHVVPHPYEDPFGRTRSVGGRTDSPKSLYTYGACWALLSKPHQGAGLRLALGNSMSASAWRILQSEVVAGDDVLVTLKSLSAFGILPAVDIAKVPEEFRKPVTDAVERVLNSAFREAPISVIDHCRDALTTLLSRWLVAQGHDRSILGKDLGEVGTIIAGADYTKEFVSRMAWIVGRLHSRGKTNEAYSRGLRVPDEEDAELALCALGFTLRDIGWAA